jgi:cytidine deaminase
LNDIIVLFFQDSATQDLIRKGVSAREFAYCPYSKFQVGAALLCSDGTVFTGCNVENVSYGISICAERTAIVKAVSSGNKSYKAIVISADYEGTFVSPCGACRQFIAEFGSKTDVYLAKPDLSEVLITSISDLLPLSFKF